MQDRAVVQQQIAQPIQAAQEEPIAIQPDVRAVQAEREEPPPAAPVVAPVPPEGDNPASGTSVEPQPISQPRQQPGRNWFFRVPRGDHIESSSPAMSAVCKK